MFATNSNSLSPQIQILYIVIYLYYFYSFLVKKFGLCNKLQTILINRFFNYKDY